MIAEAASAGCGPIVYQAADAKIENGHRTKQDRMVDNMLEKGYGSRIDDPSKIAGELEVLLKGEREYPRLMDSEIAAERLMEIIGG
jgi:hypothetical protein